MAARTDLDWVRHRNGVCGRPFRCAIDGDAVAIAFDLGYDDATGEQVYDDPFVVPFAVITGARAALGADAPYVSARDGRYGITILADYDDADKVCVTDLDADPAECATATFAIDLLVEERTVGFGYNSWRGDHYHDRCLAVHGARPA